MDQKVSSLQELLIQEVKSLVGLELFLARCLERFQHHAQNQVLKETFAREAGECSELSERLQSYVETPFEPESDPTLRALLEDTNRRLTTFVDPHLVDSELIATLRRVMALQVAYYTSIETRARLLNLYALGELAGGAVKRKRLADGVLAELDLHQVHWRTRWWNDEPASPWERLKTALGNDWRASFKRGSRSAGDTFRELRKPLSACADRLVEDEEPAFKYGYGAAVHFDDSEWSDELEKTLMMNYGGHWVSSRAQIRSGWDYQRQISALNGVEEVSA